MDRGGGVFGVCKRVKRNDSQSYTFFDVEIEHKNREIYFRVEEGGIEVGSFAKGKREERGK